MIKYKSGQTPKMGDIVYCIDPEDSDGLLLTGREYKVLRMLYGEMLDIDKAFKVGGWNPFRFSLAKRDKIEADEIKLNLGCFHKKMYGFINVDARSDVHPDVVDDMCKLEKFDNDSVDLIYACHSFEHLDRNGAKTALKRWYEVLKVGGTLRLSVPDFEKIAGHYLFYRDLKWLSHMLNGSQKHEYDMHLMMYDQQLLTEYLEEAGFKKIKRYDHNKTEHAYIDDYAAAYFPAREIPHGRTSPEPVLMSLNVEAQK